MRFYYRKRPLSILEMGFDSILLSLWERARVRVI
jgi:hypothetical protein